MDLTRHSNTGVRWQAQMEEHLASARGFSFEAVRIASANPEGAQIRATLAQANATAALALATVNAIGDLELPLSSIAETLRQVTA